MGGVKTNLDLGSALYAILSINTCPKKKKWIGRTLKWHYGNRNQLVTAIIVWGCGIKLSQSGYLLVDDYQLLSPCSKCWVSHNKQWHNIIRKSRGDGDETLPNGDVAQLLYMDLMYGRSEGTLDWHSEIRKRVTDIGPKYGYDGNNWTQSEADRLIKNKLDDVYRHAPMPKSGKTFEDFFDERFTWAASGSAPGYSGCLDQEKLASVLGVSTSELGRLRVNKRSVCEVLEAKDILKLLDCGGYQVAKGHIKANELGGKIRPIFGVALWHYILSEYVATDIESSLNYEGIDLREEAKLSLKGIEERRSWC
nr:MAG: RNA dependent RNA polymerase [Palkane botybirna-like virus]